MLVIGLDLETTGTDKVKDRPIEVGLALWTTNYNRVLDSRSFLVKSDGVPVTDEVTEITGITQKMVDKFGYEPNEAFEEMMYFVKKAEAIVAFNGNRFDIPMCKAWADRLSESFPDMQVIDPFLDLPKFNHTPSPGMRSQELITMCAKEGIYYDPHEAGADVSAMLRLMAKRPFEQVMARAQSPTIVLQSHQRRDENDLAKQHKFRWNPDYKIWWKAVKEIDAEILRREIGDAFRITEIENTVEELDGNN